MSDNKPHFRFFPTAYELEGTFECSDAQCGACLMPAEFLYVGGIYTSTEPEPKLCARCIADGRASSVLENGFSFHNADLKGVSSELYAEAMERTPGFATFNPFTWPVTDSVPMAFLGYADNPGFWRDLNIREAMIHFWRETMGEDLESPTAYLLVFRSLDGQQLGFAVDLD